MARVEPAGSVVRLFVKDLYIPIHSERARASRRVDECGFGAMFEMLSQINNLALERGVLDLKFAGARRWDRPTFVLVRKLPYGQKVSSPTHWFYIDQQWLLREQLNLLPTRAARCSAVRLYRHPLNPGLTEKDFTF